MVLLSSRSIGHGPWMGPVDDEILQPDASLAPQRDVHRSFHQYRDRDAVLESSSHGDQQRTDEEGANGRQQNPFKTLQRGGHCSRPPSAAR